jgi:methionyl-tRNA formyltransferase
MKIVFMGTPEAAVPTLEKLIENGHQVVEVWTQPDRPSGRGNKLTPPPVKVCAEKHGIPVFQPERIKTIAARNRFVSNNAEAAVVVAYGRILTKTYLEAFPMGCINVHFSLLPAYRGAAPVNWAIARGEKMTGVTTMKMDAGLDTGDILKSSSLKILDGETTAELTQRLAVVGADLLIKTLDSFSEITPIKQDETLATHAPMLAKSDGSIDWTMNAAEIVNRVRAFQPFPKSYSEFDGVKITFWRVEVEDAESSGKPGEVIESYGDNLLITGGSGSVLRVFELQVPGKARMKTRDFLNGMELVRGDVFKSG